jgi:xanthine dehydrogenase accessory factor
MRADTLIRLRDAKAAKRPVALVTRLSDAAEALVFHDRVEGNLALAEPVVEAARDALRHDRSRTVEADGARFFLHAFNPPLRLVLVGAVHIAQPLSRMAALAGWDVTVIDPRGAFATEERFPGITLSDEWPDEAMAALAPDTRTAVVTLTHDPKLDDPALEVALRSPAFYVGALGSRKTHAARVGRLKEAGLDDAAIARIHGPVGLPLGGRAPAEIAVAILAQIVQALHTGD